MNLEELIKQWQMELGRLNRSRHTISAYSQDFFDFKHFYQEHHNRSLLIADFNKITPQDIRAWLLFRRKKGMNTRSSARGLAGIKSFANFLFQRQLIEDHAIFHARSPKLQKTLPRPVSVDQAITITSSIQDMSECFWVGLRNQALMQLLYYTGMRISEALNLSQGDILNGQFITVIGKGKKTRQVPIIEPIRELILRYLQAQPFAENSSAPLFYGKLGKRLQASIVQKLLRDFRRAEAMPESLTPHALRHSCATHLMQSSHDLRGIQELLGHASLSSTQIYTQIDVQSLMNTYQSSHPRAKNLGVESSE